MSQQTRGQGKRGPDKRRRKRSAGPHTGGRPPRVGPPLVPLCVRVTAEARADFAARADAEGLSQPAYFLACMEAKKRIDSLDTLKENTSQSVATHSEVE